MRILIGGYHRMVSATVLSRTLLHLLGGYQFVIETSPPDAVRLLCQAGLWGFDYAVFYVLGSESDNWVHNLRSTSPQVPAFVIWEAVEPHIDGYEVISIRSFSLGFANLNE